MHDEYLKKLTKDKSAFHKKCAKTPFEEKIKIIIELQKMSIEMQKKNTKRPEPDKKRCVWEIEDSVGVESK